MACNVKVAVRVRPLSGPEKARSEGSCVRYPNPNQVVIGKRPFTFDHLFKPESKQLEIFGNCVEPLLSKFVKGYNATILAYGQTGSGKTFTMGTSSARNLSKEKLGIVPRVIGDLFKKFENESKIDGSHDVGLKVSFLEIHKEQINDLLSPGNSKSKPTIREDPRGGIHVDGVLEETVTSREELVPSPVRPPALE